MNPYQPSANPAAAEHRIESRRAAAAEYRLARALRSNQPSGVGAVRLAVGNRMVILGTHLVDLGRQLSHPDRSLPTV